MSRTVQEQPREPRHLVRRHMLIGWWSLLAFAAGGLALEMLHGFKVAAYLDVSNDTRRLMWRLAHAHGALVGLVHLAFALSLAAAPALGGRHQGLISTCLLAAGLLLPGGFFLGGVAFYAGDPGLGVLLVPVGACLFLAALYLTARGVPPAR